MLPCILPADDVKKCVHGKEPIKGDLLVCVFASIVL